MITKKAGKIIQAGGLVVFPTETVYGLGASAFNENACLKIYEAKGRPKNNPLIVHVATLQQAEELAIFNKEAYLLSKLWPGPLTMVLPRKDNTKVAKSVTAGLETIAIRIPAHKIACDLIKQSKVPIAAPSANKSGYLSPTSYEHVKYIFKDIFIINSEHPTQYGIESTIVDLSSMTETVILRLGSIAPNIIEQILDKEIQIIKEQSIIRAPGMMYSHYAPKTPIRINARFLKEREIGLNFGNSKLDSKKSLNLSPRGDLATAAMNLFGYLYTLDKYAEINSLLGIAVAPIPNISIGLAINERLIRASALK